MNAMLLESINRSCGYCLGYGAAPAQRTAPCGLSALDNAAGGGIPVGRIVEIFGGEARRCTLHSSCPARRFSWMLTTLSARTCSTVRTSTCCE